MHAVQRFIRLTPAGGVLLASVLLGSGLLASGLLGSGLLGSGLLSADAEAPIPFPTDYRNWAHVKSVLVGPQSPAFKTEAGIHHIYANERAMQGYRAGRFPDGSIIVYDLLETKEVGGNTIEGAQRRLDVMVKDSRRFKDSEGWRFASFRGGDRADGQLVEEKQRACLGCHAKRKDHDYVFSEFRQ